jgi:hypothetical protein
MDLLMTKVIFSDSSPQALTNISWSAFVILRRGMWKQLQFVHVTFSWLVFSVKILAFGHEPREMLSRIG